MKKLLLLAILFAFGFVACQERKAISASTGVVKEKKPALCAFNSVDSVTALARLVGKWELKGVQTNSMGIRQDEFLVDKHIGPAKELTFFSNRQYEERLDGKLQGERQAFTLTGQSLRPVAYQFWFCDENTLVVSNVAADGATEVYTRK